MINLNDDSVIASKLKEIYIENKDKDIEFVNDYFILNWSDLLDILFEPVTKQKIVTEDIKNND